MNDSPKVSVLFVCLGNICRSPTAQGVFQKLVADAGLSDRIDVDSAGTGDWHIGYEPDQRAQQHALKRGYDLSSLRARQVTSGDFEQFDYILGMDAQNVLELQAMSSPGYSGHLALFLDFLDEAGKSQGIMEVADPYYGGEAGFELVLDMVERASANLLSHICKNKL